MKKGRCFVIAMILIVSIGFYSTVYADESSEQRSIRIHMNGVQVELQHPVLKINGKTMVSQEIFSKFGAEIEWEEETQTLTAASEGTMVNFTIGEKQFYGNGSVKPLSQAPVLIHCSVVYIPVREAAEQFGGRVGWNEDTQTAVIHFPKNSFISEGELNAGDDLIEKDFLLVSEPCNESAVVSGHSPTAVVSTVKSDHVPILMYHYVSNEHDPSTEFISPETLREHFEALREAGYVTISEEDLLEYVQSPSAEQRSMMPDKPLLITFDDGYLNNYEYVFPLLQEMEMKATIYIIVDYRENQPRWNKYFNWEQTQEMADSGWVSFQSHTFDSHYLIPGTKTSFLKGKLTLENGNKESNQQYEDRINDDLKQSKALIEEKTGQEVISFAYPYGQYTEQTEQWLKEQGYQMSMTVKKGFYRLGDDLWELPRIAVDGRWSGQQLLQVLGSDRRD